MSEISREEAIHYLENTKEEKICKDCNYVPCSAREECEKQLSYLDKAISDMQKLEKIEEAIPDIEHLEELMIKMFEEWDCFKEHSYFEKLGIGIFSEGMQTVGYILDCLRD